MAKNDKKIVINDKETHSSEIGRKFKQNPALYIGSVVILILVVIAFVGGDFLSAGGGQRGGDLTFGYYDNAPITFVPGNMFSQYRERARQHYQSIGEDINSFRIDYQIWWQAYEAAIVHIAILQMIKRSNYTVPEKIVNKQVAQLPQFQENRRFSDLLYNQLTESARMNIWREVQDELNKSMFTRDYFYEILISSGEADFIANMGYVLRNFEVVSFNVDAYPDAEYLAYARENAELFGTVHLSMISVNASEREARRILDSIKDGVTTFEDAARAQSLDNYGDMGSRYYYELEREIPDLNHRETIANLGRGELSDVIRVGDGWAFFRIEEELTPADFDDAVVMDRVRMHIRNYERGRMEDWAIEQARDFILEAEEVGFDNAARYRYLDKQSFGPLPLNYGGVELFTALESFSIPGLSTQDVQNLSRNENFWRAAFSTELRTPSEPLVQGSNVLVLLPVEQTTADEEKIKEIESIYTSYWLTSMTEQSIQYYFRSNPRMKDNFNNALGLLW